MRVHRAGVCGVKGLDAQTFQSCDIRQVRHAAGRCETLDKICELDAIGAHYRAFGREILNKSPRHCLKENVANQLRNDRVARGQCVDQATVDIVAINRKTTLNVAVMAGNTLRVRRIRIEQRCAESLLHIHGCTCVLLR